jgi:hypothetical protein
MPYGYSVVDSDSQTIFAAAFSLVGANWRYYVGNDAPEGGYYLDSPEGNPVDTATITLAAPLQAGTTYYVFFCAWGYDTFSKVKLTVGGTTSAEVVLDDREGTGINIWTPRDHTRQYIRLRNHHRDQGRGVPV